MALLSEPFDPDQPNQLLVVNRRPEPDLPDHVLGDSIHWFIQSNITAPGYYLWSKTFQEYDAVEFFDTHWHRVFANEGSYFTCLNDCIEPETEGTGYWRITDPQHPQYTAPPQHPPLPFSAAGPSRLSERVRTPTPILTTPREPRHISLEEDEPSPYPAFADNPDLSPESPRDAHLASTFEQQQEEVLVAQFQHVLDVREQLPEDPATPGEPRYLQLVQEAVELGVNVPPPPPLEDPEDLIEHALPAPVVQPLLAPGPYSGLKNRCNV